jgi:hypothetical protein
MKIALFYLAKPRYGGWVTFTTHLYNSLKLLGYNVNLFKITKKFEQNQRHFNQNVFYQNLDNITAENISKEYYTIITALDKSFIDVANVLLKNKSNIVIHDPTEMKEKIIETLIKNNINPITIRKINVDNLKKFNLNALYIPHPYIPSNLNKIEKTLQSCAISRIDFDKHTSIIVEANLKLKDKIKIYGSENTMYSYHKLVKVDVNWKNNYFGVFSNKRNELKEILLKTRFMIDLSAIKNDGGGTQYTFLEAWDNYCIPILNKKWETENSFMKHNYNCIYISDANDLINVIENTKYSQELVSNGLKSMTFHEGKKIAKMYIDKISI